MNKQEFLGALRNALGGLPQSEIDRSVAFYDEIIDDAVENGESEEAVIERIGSVEDAAQKIINDTPLSVLVKENVKKRHLSGSTIALLILSSPVWLPVGAAVFAVVLAVYLSLWAVAASLFITSASLAAGGLALAFAAPFIFFDIQEPKIKAMLFIGVGLTGIGSGIFMFYISVLFSKLLVRLTALIIKRIKLMFVK